MIQPSFLSTHSFLQQEIDLVSSFVMTGQVESFELESSESLQHALLIAVDDSTTRRTISWHHHVWALLRTRTIGVVLAGICIVIGFSSIPTRSALKEKLPTKASVGLQLGDSESTTSVGLLPLGDDENSTTSFLIGDIRSSSTCCAWHSHGDLGVLPYGEELDRTLCENHTDDGDD